MSLIFSSVDVIHATYQNSQREVIMDVQHANTELDRIIVSIHARIVISNASDFAHAKFKLINNNDSFVVYIYIYLFVVYIP